MRFTKFFNTICEKMVTRKSYKLTKLKKYDKIFIEKREKRNFL